jgi:hypothetical protein
MANIVKAVDGRSRQTVGKIERLAGGCAQKGESLGKSNPGKKPV